MSKGDSIGVDLLLNPEENVITVRASVDTHVSYLSGLRDSNTRKGKDEPDDLQHSKGIKGSC